MNKIVQLEADLKQQNELHCNSIAKLTEEMNVLREEKNCEIDSLNKLKEVARIHFIITFNSLS